MFKQLCGIEQWGGAGGTLTISIMVNVHRPFTDADLRAGQDAMDALQAVMQLETLKADPVACEERDAMRKELWGLFAQPIYAKEIPNEYDDTPWCKMRPWFLVTTVAGPIKIGWRKRVINIDWSASAVVSCADDLFPYSKDATKGNKYIHAWSYAEAKEYIAKIMAAHEAQVIAESV